VLCYWYDSKWFMCFRERKELVSCLTTDITAKTVRKFLEGEAVALCTAYGPSLHADIHNKVKHHHAISREH
jgi:hypothetical protein